MEFPGKYDFLPPACTLVSRPHERRSPAARLAALLLNAAVHVKLALRRRLMSAFPIGYQIWFTPGNFDEPLIAAIAGHRRLKRLFNHPALRVLLAQQPQMLYRPYLRFLATGFTKRARRAALHHHYATLAARVSETFCSELLQHRPVLWQMRSDPELLEIRISFTYALHHEGDLQLIFLRNSMPLYYLGFTIAPGSLAGCAADDVMLVARVQGVAGNVGALRVASKACRDVSPPALLMATLQGVAHALNIGMIAGVTNKVQLTSHIDADRHVYFDYDAFWATYPGDGSGEFYLIRVPIPEKPLAQISTGHRRRTRLKRQFKREVAELAQTAFGNFLRSAASRRRYGGAELGAEFGAEEGAEAAGRVSTRALRSGT